VSGRRLWTIVVLELTQRVRSVAWYVLLGIFAAVLLVVTALSFATLALSSDGGGMLFSFLICLVLLLVLLVSPTLSGSTVNGDRDAATLAPMQVTLATTAEILLGKFVAAWIAGLAFLAVALPFLVLATLAGGLAPATIVTSLAVLVVEVGVVAGIGVGFSAVLARPLFSVACTYLVVAALTIGTVIGFALGGLSTRVEITVTDRSPVAYGEAGDDVRCTDWQTYTYDQPRFDHVWWLLAANPFVVLADATPTSYSDFGYPDDLFGQIATGVRLAQIAPETEQRRDYCDSASMPDDQTTEELVRGTSPSWFVGLLVQVLLTAGLMWWGWARTRTPARQLPPGTRIA
jgi:ABC-type transport system involved in multi-copper enzyme maturation permease subunit